MLLNCAHISSPIIYSWCSMTYNFQQSMLKRKRTYFHFPLNLPFSSDAFCVKFVTGTDVGDDDITGGSGVVLWSSKHCL